MSGTGIEALAMGLPLAAQPRFAYTATWYPDTSAGGAGHTLGLVGVNERVFNALKVTHVENFFRFFDTLDDARKTLGA